jgi:hypothetical protein
MTKFGLTGEAYGRTQLSKALDVEGSEGSSNVRDKGSVSPVGSSMYVQNAGGAK